MDNLDIYLLIISAVISLKMTKEIFTVSCRNKDSKEIDRFFNKMCEDKGDCSDHRDREFGLALAKHKKDEKYRLIPQSKLVGLELF